MNRLLTGFDRLLLAVATLALALMIGHVTLEVVLRLFGVVSQLQTITFVSAWYMVAVIFCALPYAQRSEGHITVDIFTSMLPDPIRALLGRAVSALSAAYLGLLAYLSIREAWDKTADGEVWETSTGYFQIWPGRWAIALAFTSLALFYTLQALKPSDAHPPSDSVEVV